MIFHDYVRIARRDSWLVGVMLILGAVGGLAFASTSPDKFTSRATLLISVRGSESPSDLQQSAVFATQRAATYAGLAGTSSVLESAVTQLSDGTTVEALQNATSVTARDESALIDVDTSAEQAQAAADRANAVAAALEAEITLADTANTPVSVQATTVQPGTVPEIAVEPRPRNNAVAGAIAGLALAVVVVAVRETLDDKVRGVSDLPLDRTLRLLATLPRASASGKKKTAFDERRETLRRIASKMRSSGQDALFTVAPVSSKANADAMELADGLASVMSESGHKVLLFSLHAALAGPVVNVLRRDPWRSGFPKDQEATDALLVGQADTPSGEFTKLELGATGFSVAQLVDSESGREAMAELQRDFDHVILLCPSATEGSAAVAVADTVGATLLVASAAQTTRAELRLANTDLAAARAPFTSLVLIGNG